MIITILLQVSFIEYAKYVIMFPIQDYGDGFVTSIISQQAFFYYLLSFASVIFFFFIIVFCRVTILPFISPF